MNLATKKMIDAIDDEIERISHFQDNIKSFSDTRRYELLEQLLFQYKALLEGNKNLLKNMKG